jgi:hypothetical protein
MLFLNAIGEKENELGNSYKTTDLSRRMERLQTLIGIDPDIMARIAVRDDTVRYDPEFLRMSNLQDMFVDVDKLFELYLKDVRMGELAKVNCVKMKRQHSLVEKRPYGVTDSTSRRDFELMCTLGGSGRERYVEVERVK